MPAMSEGSRDKDIWAVLPVKDLDGAKQRLAGVLAPAERRALFAAMVEDVLEALAAVRGLAGIVAVTRDAGMAELAGRYGARILTEPANRGHTAAVATAQAALAADGAGGMLQVPGDIPTLAAAELEQVIAAHGAAPAVTIVPSRDHGGSNCVVCSPPGLLPVRFGDDSFRPHLAAARALGVEPRVLEHPGIGLDIDTPEDLAELVRRPGLSRAHAWTAAHDIAARLAGRQPAQAG